MLLKRINNSGTFYSVNAKFIGNIGLSHGGNNLYHLVWIKGREKNIEDAFKIRFEVFVHEQGVPEDIELDDIDDYAEHLVVYKEDRPIATGRWFLEDGKVLLGRIAVLKDHRGSNLGNFLMSSFIDRIFSQGFDEIYLHAQTRVRGFYEKIGFNPYGDVYDEAGIEHVSMVLKNQGI